VTLFEYTSVAFSIVLSLGAASLLRALPSVFAPGRRYWIHATWVVSFLFLHALAWWSLWSYNRVESWTLLTFLLVLLQPGLLYLNTSVLVGEALGSNECWRDRFYGSRRWFFSVRVCYVTVIAFASWQVLGVELLHPARAFGTSHIALSVVGIATANERAQAALAAVEFLLILARGFVVFAGPVRWGAA
jgi:hypothetical protein